MDKKDGIRTENLPKKGVSIINRNLAVFAFFLFLSFVFWYLNSLGKDIETDIRYPVSYINLPGKSDPPEELPSRLNLYLKGPGYSILRLKISGKTAPLVMDFSKISYRRVPGSKSNDYYIVTAGLVPNMNSQLKSVCKITAVRPDTLFFSLRQNSR